MSRITIRVLTKRGAHIQCSTILQAKLHLMEDTFVKNENQMPNKN